MWIGMDARNGCAVMHKATCLPCICQSHMKIFLSLLSTINFGDWPSSCEKLRHAALYNLQHGTTIESPYPHSQNQQEEIIFLLLSRSLKKRRVVDSQFQLLHTSFSASQPLPFQVQEEERAEVRICHQSIAWSNCLIWFHECLLPSILTFYFMVLELQD